jgi:hypothetical protein
MPINLYVPPTHEREERSRMTGDLPAMKEELRWSGEKIVIYMLEYFDLRGRFDDGFASLWLKEDLDQRKDTP